MQILTTTKSSIIIVFIAEIIFIIMMTPTTRYSVKAFYLAKTCADLPFQVSIIDMIMMATMNNNDDYHGHCVTVVFIFKCIYQIIFPLIYVLIVYFMTAQPLDPARYLTSFLDALASLDFKV